MKSHISTGMTVHRWTVLSRVDSVGQLMFLCRCQCGTERAVRSCHLTRGNSKSCGCLNRELSSARAKARNLKHGHSPRGKFSSEYKSWASMRARCSNPATNSFEYYGGRGIKVCDSWEGSFKEFLKDMGLKPSPLHSIDRINSNGNYEPGNCRWATKKEQRHNRRALP